ncbi:MAG: OFA family MFS transporter [Betaproteobacteria bacterium]|nr:OFA family MFS transporter [Betaproteobacteria bacterium]OZB45152.1 MAG: MFS transporter [Thiomonas sp. 15-66-11]OZB63186.1 MAG: MFS transporter [Thiomonas sp. 13-66-29]
MSEVLTTPLPAAGLLDRERTVAGPRFNRWLVPPAALAIHLCIGMAYGFSVFWLPMSKLLGNTDAALCTGMSFWGQLTTTSCNWSVPSVTHIFEIFIAFLGISAAIWGGWLEHAGPRKAGFIAALCWGGGLILGGLGVSMHQLWLVILGCGVLGGIGLGLGYISPVSTLIKWFPDRRGMATGFAIMGFGGGAMIGAPLAVALMKHFSATSPQGVAPTLMLMGALYIVIMSAGAFGFRVPPSDWKPSGWTPKEGGKAMITDHEVHLNKAWKTPQFWLVWGVLCLNVTAGIGVLSMASPMLQDVFGARLIGVDATATLSAAQKAAIVAAAGGLVGLISLFNSVGRLFWAALSDHIGRKATYYTFFILGIVLYASLPTLGHIGAAGLFVVVVCVIMTMYGGGFSTVPAYLADLFGTQMVGAIHGRLLTAWSVAGVAGPFLIAAIRQTQINAGVAHNLVYDRTLYILAGLLFVGFILNLLVRPVDPKYRMTAEELAQERALKHEDRVAGDALHAARGAFGIVGVLAWAAVGIPFLIGVFIALQKAAVLF